MIQFAHQINDDSMIHLMMKGEMNEDRLFFLGRLTFTFPKEVERSKSCAISSHSGTLTRTVPLVVDSSNVFTASSVVETFTLPFEVYAVSRGTPPSQWILPLELR